MAMLTMTGNNALSKHQACKMENHSRELRSLWVCACFCSVATKFSLKRDKLIKSEQLFVLSNDFKIASTLSLLFLKLVWENTARKYKILNHCQTKFMHSLNRCKMISGHFLYQPALSLSPSHTIHSELWDCAYLGTVHLSFWLVPREMASLTVKDAGHLVFLFSFFHCMLLPVLIYCQPQGFKVPDNYSN